MTPAAASHAPVPVPASVQRQRSRAKDHWPLCSYLELAALPSAVPCARLHARQLFWEWGRADLSDTAELLISELLTNAVKASRALEPAMPVRLWLLSGKGQVVMAVWDANSRPPVRSQAEADDETGRGLQLVEALSTYWNWYRTVHERGKVVWAAIGSE